MSARRRIPLARRLRAGLGLALPLALGLSLAREQSSAASDAARWSCTEPRWVGDVGMDQGRFKGKVAVDCAVEGMTRAGFAELGRELVGEAGARPEAPGAYAVSRTLVDGGDTIRLDEELMLRADSPSRLEFTSVSSRVEGSGLASYLRALEFRARFVRDAADPSRVRIELVSGVEVERPWYAPSPLFSLVARGKTKSKFAARVRELMPRYVARL